MAEVFVSYASGDKESAFRIAAFLEDQGIVCWIAPRDVPPGTDYGTAILEGIEGCSAFVLILSEEANDSTFVRKEVERAVSKGKPVLPVRIREVSPSGALEFIVSSSQWVDAWRSPMEQHLAVLADAIVVLRGDGAVRTAAQRSIPSAPKRRLGVMIVLGAVILLAAAGGLWAWQPWLAPWQKSVPDYLAGSWCRSDTGNSTTRFDFVRASDNSVRGEIHFSHSYDVIRIKAATESNAEGFILHWSEPGGLVKEGPTSYNVIDEVSLEILPDDPKDTSVVLLTRCAADTGN